MDSGNDYSTECDASTVFDASISSDSDQCYGEDDFEDYSDSFEADNEATFGASVIVTNARNLAQINVILVGTRVQVFWREENEWFDGTVHSVRHDKDLRYYVHYDDGEQQWEITRTALNVRPLPGMPADAVHLQQLLPLSTTDVQTLIARRVTVYMPDKSKWYNGTVSATHASPLAIKIDYDDGSSRWEQEHTLNCVLLLKDSVEAPEVSYPTERILYARSYRQAVSDHFQSVRIARSYNCAVENHTESMLIPRRFYAHSTPSFIPEKTDRIVQATVPV